jgi:hypothetical protein
MKGNTTEQRWASSYPLTWPGHVKRTAPTLRRRSRFKTNFAVTRDRLIDEIRRMGGRYPVISTNVETRRDGLPYANRSEPGDPGVAVYFEMDGRQLCIACDRWDLVKDNLHAVRLTVEALPPPKDPAPAGWREVLQTGNDMSDSKAALLARAERHFRILARDCHPDKGGDPEEFRRLVEAREAARRELS